MGIRILVGNLTESTNNLRLEQLFAPFGSVRSAKVATDLDDGLSQRHGHVTMTSEKDAELAIAALNGRIIDGQTLNVSRAASVEEIPQTTLRPRYGNGRSGGGGVRWGRRS